MSKKGKKKEPKEVNNKWMQNMKKSLMKDTQK